MDSFLIGHKSNPAAGFKIDHDTVSYEHVLVERPQDGLDDRLRLTNKSSTSLPLVQGLPFRAITYIESGQVLRVGDCDLPYDRLARKLPRRGHIFFHDFEQLEPLFEKFERENKKISSTYKFKITYFRFGIMIVAGLLFAALSAIFDLNDKLVGAATLVLSFLGVLFANRLFPLEQVQQQKKELRKKYKDSLVCPKRCGQSLMNESYEEHRLRGHCPNANCNAQYAPL